MNQTELQDFLYAWLLAILPTGTPIILSHQNAAGPGVKYVVIDVEGEWDSFGFSSQGIPTPGDTAAHQADALSTRIKDYTVAIALWEVDGDGELLRTALESLETKTVDSLFHDKQVSVLSYGTISAMPRISDLQWRTEHRVPLSLHIARTFQDPTTYIETVQFINQIGGI